MKWIGQNIWSFISRFRSDVYLEASVNPAADVDKFLVQGTDGKVGFRTGAEVLSDIGGSSTAGDITGVTAGTGLSGGGTSGAVTLNVEATQGGITTLAALTSFGSADATTGIRAGDVTMYNTVNDGNPTFSIGASATNRFETSVLYNSGAQTLDQVVFNTHTTSTTTNDGRYVLQVDDVALLTVLDTGIVSSGFVNASDGFVQARSTTASSATEGGAIILLADDGAAMGDDHRLGVIEFKGAEDASNNSTIGARIEAMCDAAWSASENGGRLDFYTTNGNASESKVLTLDSNKLATFTGGVTVDGTITGNVTGDLTGAADTVATIAGLAPNTATTQATQAAITSCSNLVTVGTIGTGVWNGTAIATDQQKHLAFFKFIGYGTADGTNYYIPNIVSDTNAPFEHGTNTGSDGLTAQTTNVIIRAGGTTMPRAGNIKVWRGWSASAGTATINISLFKATPTRNDSTNLTPVLLKNTTFSALGNAKMEDFDETSFSVAVAEGDILFTGVQGGTNNKTFYFTSTMEIEWT